jgi:hypothetical protein
MRRSLGAWFFVGSLFLPSLLAKAQDDSAQGLRPLVFSDAVIATPARNPLTEPRIFNPEFYCNIILS